MEEWEEEEEEETTAPGREAKVVTGASESLGRQGTGTMRRCAEGGILVSRVI